MDVREVEVRREAGLLAGGEGILDGRGGSQVVERVAERLLLSLQADGGVFELQQGLLLCRGALERAADPEGEWGWKQGLAEILRDVFVWLATDAVGEADDVLHVSLDFGGQDFDVLRLFGWAILQPFHLGNQVGLRAHHVDDAESLLAFADHEEAVVDQTLVLDDLPHASHCCHSYTLVRKHHPESQVGLQERVHHDPVPELENLQRENRTWT
jgi:hypothetical protein